jgi:alpha-tubulin suppressor-like RCC1 family protein
VSRVALLALGFVLALLAGCGGGGSSGTPTNSVTRTIGVDGGTIAGPGGVTLTVPAGALAADTALTIAIDDAGAPPLPGSLPLQGETIALLPHGMNFSVPVTLSMTMPAGSVAPNDELVLLKTSAARDGWEALVTERDGDRISAAITGFSNVRGSVIGIAPGWPVQPSILSEPRNCSVAEGGWCFFRVEAFAPRPGATLRYQWLRGGVPLAGEVDALLFINPVSVADDGARFSVQVRIDGFSPVLSATAALQVTALPPVIVTQPLGLQATIGSTAVFSAASTSSLPQALQWKRCNATQACPNDPAAWTNTLGGTGSTFALPGVQAGDDGARFAMCASNSAGSACSRSATLTVVPAPTQPAILDQPDDVNTVAGRSAQFVVRASGGNLSYQWERSAVGAPFQPIAGETSATYTISNVVPADDGAQLRVVVSNALGSVISREATLSASATAALALSRVQGGLAHSVGLRADARIVAWGANGQGQLGRGSFGAAAGPALVEGLADAAAIGSGWWHNLALGSDGSVLAWGGGGGSQIGDFSDEDRALPVSPLGLPPARAVAGGVLHSLVVAANTALWAFGTNDCGQLGDGTTVRRARPVPIGAPYIAAAAGDEHSLALRSDGSVWSWGCNGVGQLGDGTLQARVRAVPVAGLPPVLALAAGGAHSLALGSDGTVWAWGSNAAGQVGDSSNMVISAPVRVSLPGIAVAVAAGAGHSLALLSDGRVYAWGWNNQGQLGTGSNLDAHAPLRIATPLPADLVSIGAGRWHSLALDRAGNVWAWGGNDEQQLGDGTVLPRNRPQQVPGVNLN